MLTSSGGFSKGIINAVKVLDPFTPPGPEKRRASEEGVDESWSTCDKREVGRRSWSVAWVTSGLDDGRFLDEAGLLRSEDASARKSSCSQLVLRSSII